MGRLKAEGEVMFFCLDIFGQPWPAADHRYVDCIDLSVSKEESTMLVGWLFIRNCEVTKGMSGPKLSAVADLSFKNAFIPHSFDKSYQLTLQSNLGFPICSASFFI